MSKLIELLDKTTEASSSPLGFGAASGRIATNLQIVLIGQAAADEINGSSTLADSKADAVLVTMTSLDGTALDGIQKALKDRLWGVRVGALSEEQAVLLKEKGCDFVVFDPENTAAAVLNDRELGAIIAVNADLDEETGGAITGLSLDAAIYAPGESLIPLTVQRLIEVQLVRDLVGKHFLISIPAGMTTSDLEALKNAGIAGMVMNLSSHEDIAKAKEAIDRIPHRRPKSRDGGRYRAQVPSAGFVVASQQEVPDIPDDDDDEDDE
ncbi:MAG: hypothetical protein IIC83_12970 [Chloroflexi bacterium]|nr:hypothetical protein [Chloroflexota bacterium]